jgi:hypothetical protein
MDIREAYRREFLITLRESPAWEAFITAMLKEMSFIQDDVKFTMGGVPSRFNIVPEFINGQVVDIQEGTVLELTVDINDVVIKASNCQVSNDGNLWYETLSVKEHFYLKSKISQPLENIVITCQQFYPNMISCNDIKLLMARDGLEREDVVFSSFGDYMTATSPYLVHYILTRLGESYNMEYLFDNGTEVEVTGSKSELVREGIYLQRVSGNVFYYESHLTLVAGKDYIRDSLRDYPILSVNKNTLTCDIPSSAGEFSVLRTEFITPLNIQYPLFSALELDFDRTESDYPQRFIDRVTPVRCASGFRGEVDVRITTTMNLTADFAVQNIGTRSEFKFEDEISWVLNQLLSLYLESITDEGLKVIDLSYNDYQTEQIVLS